MIPSAIITEIRRVEREARILRECEALDRAYAEADAFESGRRAPAGAEDEDMCDEDAELRKAALSRGQP